MRRWRVHFWNDDILAFAYYETNTRQDAIFEFMKEYKGEEVLSIIEC